MSSPKGLDKNSIIGLVLIGAILLTFSWLTKPTDEEVAALEKKKQQEKAKVEYVQKEIKPVIVNNDSNVTENVIVDSNAITQNDSLSTLKVNGEFGPLSDAANKEIAHFTLENDLIKVTISNKGGRVSSVELKNFHTYDSLPLYLFHEDSSHFSMELTINDGITGNKIINTEDLYFEPVGESFNVEGENNTKSFALRLYQNNSKDKYIEYNYTLTGNSYMVDFDMNTVGFNNLIARNFPIYLDWSMFTPNQEKTIKNQQQISTIYYQYNNNKDVDNIGPMSYEEEKMETDVNWVMFKQQYFNATLIAKETPFHSDSKLETIEIPEGTSTTYVQGMKANLAIPYNGDVNEKFAMQYYFGPNKYKTLKTFDLGLENSIDYGWPIIKQVNKYFIRWVFDLLNMTGLSIGIIILLLTLIIKSFLFPITWKTYLSSAKMRVLKPEIAVLTEKFKNDKMKKQQATMALYRETGVNPMAGCIPMLIQAPILFALFRFFPATFDLRQKSFLWAEDLSTYDSIYDLGFNIPMYGDHVSLFTLLMAISMIFYTKANSQMTAGMGGDDGGMMATQMKMMTYLMPIMMLFFFNSYAAGLSLYYLIANVITIFQQFAIRKWIVNEDKLHAKLQANKTKKKKKSGFSAKLQQRMADAQKLQEQRKKKK